MSSYSCRHNKNMSLPRKIFIYSSFKDLNLEYLPKNFYWGINKPRLMEKLQLTFKKLSNSENKWQVGCMYSFEHSKRFHNSSQHSSTHTHIYTLMPGLLWG